MRSPDRGQTNNTVIADFTQAPFNYTDFNDPIILSHILKLFTPYADGNYLLVHVLTHQAQNGPTLYEKSGYGGGCPRPKGSNG